MALPAEHSDIRDVIIVGAGPAGLSAALILGRCCRRVLVVDRATPRSWASHAMHGYLSRDGVEPQLFRDEARQELARYPSIELRWEEAVSASRLDDATFVVQLAAGDRVRAKKLLLASGVSDELPDIAGVEEFFGKSVFPCPYCDGWELRGAPIAVYGRGRRGFHMARALTAWTRDLTLCTDGRTQLSRAQTRALEANGIEIESAPISKLRGTAGKLEGVLFSNGRELACRAMFFDLPCHAQSDIARSLGCEFTDTGGVRCGRYEATSVPGVFVAGNIIKDVQLSIVAAAEGARAAFGINRALTREDFARRAGAGAVIDHPGPV
jgi:thioredoxin reductase